MLSHCSAGIPYTLNRDQSTHFLRAICLAYPLSVNSIFLQTNRVRHSCTQSQPRPSALWLSGNFLVGAKKHTKHSSDQPRARAHACTSHTRNTPRSSIALPMLELISMFFCLSYPSHILLQCIRSFCSFCYYQYVYESRYGRLNENKKNLVFIYFSYRPKKRTKN